MGKVSKGIASVNLAARVTKYIPKIGTAVKILQNLLKAASIPFNNAYRQMKIIDSKLYKFKTPVDRVKNVTSTGTVNNIVAYYLILYHVILLYIVSYCCCIVSEYIILHLIINFIL